MPTMTRGDYMSKPAATGVRHRDDDGDWRSAGTSARAWFAAPSHAAGAGLVTRIAALPEIAGRNGLPDIDLRACGVGVRLRPDDVAVARAISVAAAGLGLTGEPAVLQTLQVRIDAVGTEPVTSFWQTVLGYERAGDGILTDPLRRAPAVRVGRLSEPRPLRNRIHLDVVREPGAVQAVKTAIGGQAYGANGLTLADSEGNEVDLVPGSGLSRETPDWRVLFGAMTFYPAASPQQAARLAAAVAGLADEAAVPLLIDLRPDGVVIDSGKDQWHDDQGAPGTRFADLAGRIQIAARDLGLSADPARPRFLQFGIDAADVPAVRQFWAAVLGYRYDPRTNLTDIYDPRRLNPEFFFQQMDPASHDRRRQRNRIRFDLLIPHDQLQARLGTAVAAGGQIVAQALGRYALTDPEGNEIDIIATP
jgi:predicted enzyme related to lactoylglutathione lyase